MKSKLILEANKKNYQDLYTKRQAFLRYPADWLIRFHNMYLRSHLLTGRVLDYGCGSGNNSMLFIDKGYEVYGVDTSRAALSLIKENLRSRRLDARMIRRFSVIRPMEKLPFPDGYFDFIFSNQVLYYLPSAQNIREVCEDMSRCLRPGGVVFFTMMGPRNYYITDYTKRIVTEHVHDVRIDDPGHRLHGVRELVYLVRTRSELKSLFSMFSCLSTGYFDQQMFDMRSNYHWIFIGEKPRGMEGRQ